MLYHPCSISFWGEILTPFSLQNCLFFFHFHCFCTWTPCLRSFSFQLFSFSPFEDDDCITVAASQSFSCGFVILSRLLDLNNLVSHVFLVVWCCFLRILSLLQFVRHVLFNWFLNSSAITPRCAEWKWRVLF